MADWVIVVDDDETNLKMAGHILSRAHMRVTAVKSGQTLLDYVKKLEDEIKLNESLVLDIGDDNKKENKKSLPDLILLDIKMPGMDGFETLTALKKMNVAKNIPVIFLTADEKEETEAKGLSMGAMDFIKKPFVPEVLTIRVRHMIDLDHLQSDLAYEVEKKTRENESLFFHVVSSLASAIDAKDTYTNNHSGRVAEYSREIARRAGYEGRELEDVYIMGLLHDVGKIGVPDAVINKPAKLTDEEYDIIKNHPVLGARILGNIREMPKLANGARWHHERYDGKGYPDGLKGEDIPEEARIIAVADSYDAMTSHRSYRNPLPQGVVREEIEKGMGSQFDPRFAKIMLEMIDEDTEYEMKED
ncbi:MAG: response regulator [Lachnospiraceae bacterium]|nr:response regulator [Lachnospiraceae bacterium]